MIISLRTCEGSKNTVLISWLQYMNGFMVAAAISQAWLRYIELIAIWTIHFFMSQSGKSLQCMCMIRKKGWIDTKFNTKSLNSLPHIDLDGVLRLDSYADQLLRVISGSGMRQYVGLWVPHKHFDVKEGEQVVSRRTQNSSGVIISTRVERFDATNIPITFVYKEGLWKPVVFVESNNSGAREAFKAFSSKAEIFLPKFVSYLEAVGLKNQVGLHLASNADLIKPGYFLQERTDEAARFQTFRWEKEDHQKWLSGEMIKTSFFLMDNYEIDENGNIKPMCGCHVSHGGCINTEHNGS